jgi:uncharacterized phage protein (TIGR01671 family)
MFRGKELNNSGRWAQGDLLLQRNWTTGELQAAWIGLGFSFIRGGDLQVGNVRIDPATIGQCTGMKDKNGKLIFEGDIVTWPADDYLHCTDVKWCDGCFCVADEDGEEECIFCFTDGIKIIGNIHDNPELLEAKL